ncbi:MAG TPA: aldose epimerase family protein [Chitinophagaceae bacterium]|nr:aldose epimerase family protein [Chitinophagaceae bacterium]
MNRIIRKWLHTHSTGEDIYLFTLCNAQGMEVSITNYGAIITSHKIKKRDGTVIDVVLGFDTIEDYWSPANLENYSWFGAAVGRYANRIAHARFPLDRKTIRVSDNRNGDHLHGGIEGFDKKIWRIVGFGHAPELYLELYYMSLDDEEGYPGNLEVTIRFELNDDNEFSYQYKATTDKATAVNLTHHGYFNLNGGAPGIHNHELRIDADYILEQGNNLVATGNLETVINTPFNFKDFQLIGDGLKKLDEYDKTFVLNNTVDELKHAASLKCAATGLVLDVFTTEPAVHFYSGKWIPNVKGKENAEYGAFSGLCLETHKHPNAVNVEDFPDTILRPGEIYSQHTFYKLSEIV